MGVLPDFILRNLQLRKTPHNSKPLNFDITFKMIEEYSKKREISHFVLIDENIVRFPAKGFER